MHLVLADAEIPDDVGVGIEYQIPQTAKRIDVLRPSIWPLSLLLLHGGRSGARTCSRGA